MLCESEVAALAAEVEGELLAGCGLEIHPFLTGWYDELVGEKFHLDRPPDTLALLVISQPAMFERTFLPYLAATPRQKLHDPIGSSTTSISREDCIRWFGFHLPPSVYRHAYRN